MEHGKVINGDFKKARVIIPTNKNYFFIDTFWSTKTIFNSDIKAYQLVEKPDDIITILVIMYEYKGKSCCSLLALHDEGPELFKSFIQESNAQERTDLLKIFGL